MLAPGVVAVYSDLPRAATRQRPARLWSYLVALALASVLPVVIFAIIVSTLLVKEQRRAAERAATERVIALMTAIDAELRGSITALQAFAASANLQGADRRALQDETVRVAKSQPNWLNLNVALPSGVRIADAILPPGSDLPAISDRESFDRAVASRTAAIGNVEAGAVTATPAMAIRLPVVRDGEVRFIVSAVLKADSFGQLLRAQGLPGGWAVAIADRNKRLIARIPSVTAGRAVSESFRAALERAPNGWFHGRTLEGADTYTPYVTSELSGWALGIAMPAEVIESGARRATGITLAAAALALVLAFGLAAYFSRRIAAPIISLAAEAKALGRGVETHLQPAQRLSELAEVATALKEAGDEIRSRQTALIRERGQLHAVIDAMTDGIVVFDMSGNAILANEAEARLVGYASSDEMLRSLEYFASVFEVADLAGNVLPVERWPASRVLRGEAFRDWELRARRKDTGGEWIISFSGEPVRDADGKQILALVVTRDISRQKQDEERLRESEERFRKVYEHAATGIAITDLEGRLQQCNPAHCALLGYSEEELKQRTFQSLVHPDDRAANLAGIRRLIEQKLGFFEIENRYVRKDGQIVWVHKFVSLLRDKHGAPAHLVTLVTDITERKRAEDEVRRLNESLEQRVAQRTGELAEANLEMQAFTYTVSHDLRAPLRGIQGFAQALVEDFSASLGEEGREYCQRIASAGERMEDLIEDLLAYSRLAREQIVSKPIELDVIVDEALQQLRSEVVASGANVSVKKPLGTVLAYHAVVIQVVQNLLSNAIKFVRSGRRPEVRVWSQDRPGRVRLYVEDKGIGIEKSHLNRIFNVFERLHGDEAYPGTGIGLAIVKRGTERLGGVSGVESAPGAGSRFWIELPKA